MKRILSVLLVTLLALPGVAALAAVDPTPNLGKLPISDVPITITCFNWAHSYTRGEYQDLMIWAELEKLTNIHIEFETHFTDWEEKLALKLATNDLPDLFYKTNQNNANVFKYAQDEVFAPITPYLADWAPNFSYQMDNMPNLRPAITMPDGEIYGFPYLITASAYMSLPMFVNHVWLEKLGLDALPNTLDGLKEVLIRVRDEDLNGNGVKDEIPLLFPAEAAFMYGTFGLATRGTSAPYIDIGPDGELRFYLAADGYREMLTYLNDLYADGLIYQEIFSIQDDILPSVTALGEQNLLFFLPGFAIRDYVGTTYMNDFGGVLEPFIGPSGMQGYSMSINPVAAQNTFISTTNPYPAETVAMIDYFYSDEGVRMYFMGFEGITYEWTEDGRCIYNDYVSNNPDGLNREEVLGGYVSWAGGANPSMAEDKYFGNMFPPVETAISRALMAYTPKEVWGSFRYSAEDSDRMTVLRADIDAYIKEMRAKFISGSANIETEWDTYIKTLKQIGLDEYMGIHKRGYEAYLGN